MDIPNVNPRATPARSTPNSFSSLTPSQLTKLYGKAERGVPGAENRFMEDVSLESLTPSGTEESSEAMMRLWVLTHDPKMVSYLRYKLREDRPWDIYNNAIGYDDPTLFQFTRLPSSPKEAQMLLDKAKREHATKVVEYLQEHGI